MVKAIKSISLILLILASQTHAGTVGGFGGSLEITQLANNVQLMEQYVQQVSMVQNQIEQIANQLNMYESLLTSLEDISIGSFTEAATVLMNLKSTIEQATSISYTMGSIDNFFTGLHPDYNTLFQATNYEDQQIAWRDSIYEYCEAALKTANYSISNVNSDATTLTTLMDASKSASGQKWAIQAGNNIAAHMAAKIGELNTLTATQMQSQMVYLSQREAEKEAQREHIKHLYKYDPNTTNPNDNMSF